MAGLTGEARQFRFQSSRCRLTRHDFLFAGTDILVCLMVKVTGAILRARVGRAMCDSIPLVEFPESPIGSKGLNGRTLEDIFESMFTVFVEPMDGYGFFGALELATH
jgi:hypothetical protein